LDLGETMALRTAASSFITPLAKDDTRLLL
jgi:hypothetical protein